MPKVVLEFEVTSTGEAKITQLSGAVGKLGETASRSATQSSALLDAYGKPMESAAAATTALAAKQGEAQKASSGFSLALSGVGAAVTAVNQGMDLASRIYGAVQRGISFLRDDYIALTVESRNLSYITGESISQMSLLLGAAKQMDVGSQGLTKAMFLLAREVDTGGASLAKMGIALRDEQGNLKPLSELLFEVADTTRAYGSAAEASTQLSRAFGRGVLDLIPMLRGGRDAIQEAMDTSRKYGAQISGEDLEAVAKYKQAQERFGEAMTGIKLGAGRNFLEFMADLGGMFRVTKVETDVAAGSLAEYATVMAGLTPGALGAGDLRPAAVPGHISMLMPDTAAGAANRVKETEALTRLDAEKILSLQIDQRRLQADAALLASEGELVNGVELQVAVIRAQTEAKLKALDIEAIQDPRLAKVVADQKIAISQESENKITLLRRSEWQRQNVIQQTIEQESYDDTRAMDGKDLVARARKTTDIARLLDEQVQLSEEANAAIWGDTEARLLKEQEAERRWREEYIDLLDADQRETYAQVDEGATQRTRRRADEFTQLRRMYDDDVTAAINAALLEAGIWQNSGRQHLDIVAGTYLALQTRRTQDLQNLALYYQLVAERDGSMWAAMQSGAVTAYASLGTFWGNVSKGFADTFGNVNKSLSDGFFDVLTGRFTDLSTVAENFGKAMVRSFSDILAAEATKQLLGLIGIGTSGGGGTTIGGGTGTGGGGGAGGGGLSGVLTGGGLLGTINNLSGGALTGLLGGLFGTAATTTPTVAAAGFGGLVGIEGATTGASLGAGAAAGSVAAEGAAVGGSMAGAGWLALPAAAFVVAPLLGLTASDSPMMEAFESAAITYGAAYPEIAREVARLYRTGEIDQAVSADGGVYGVSTAVWPFALAQLGYGADITAYMERESAKSLAAQLAAGVPWGGEYQDGGPVEPGRAYLVGERGPELVIPRAAGTVLPADQTRAALAGDSGAGREPIVINIDARGSLMGERSWTELIRDRLLPELRRIDTLRHGPGWAR